MIMLSFSAFTLPVIASERLQQSDTVTLATVTQSVYDIHPSQRELTARAQQVKANSDLANSFFAGASTLSVNHNNDVIGSDNGYQEWEGGVELPLWLPGQKQQQQALVDNLTSETDYHQQKIKLEASAIVREVIWNIILADTGVSHAGQVWNNALKLQHDVDLRVKAGELASTELLLADTNGFELHSQYLDAEAKLDLALARYKQITGQTFIPAVYEEKLADQVESAVANSSEPTVTQQHPLLRAFEQQIIILRTKQNLARFDSSVNPSVSVGMRSERGAHGEDFENSLGLGINIALGNDVYSQPAVADAGRALADIEVNRQTLERQLNLTLLTEYHKLSAMQKQYELLSEQNLTTQKYLGLQQRAFDLGELDLASLLRSQALADKTQNRKQVLTIEIKRQVAIINQSLGVVL